MMAHVTGQSRYQSTLFPEILDEVVSIDDAVRVMDALVETLDLAVLGFSKVAAEEMGRPPYAPGDLLKLYIYGYLHRVRASRRLFFFQAEDGIRDLTVTGVQTCALPI